jgi:hypothetical protein
MLACLPNGAAAQRASSSRIVSGIHSAQLRRASTGIAGVSGGANRELVGIFHESALLRRPETAFCRWMVLDWLEPRSQPASRAVRQQTAMQRG